jgi:hypothetical protein
MGKIEQVLCLASVKRWGIFGIWIFESWLHLKRVVEELLTLSWLGSRLKLEEVVKRVDMWK